MAKIIYTEEEQKFIDFLNSNPSRFKIIGFIHHYKKSHSLEEVKRLQSIYRKFDNGDLKVT